MTGRSNVARKLEPWRAAEAVRDYSHSASGSAAPRRSAVIHRLHPVAADDPRARRDHLAALLLIAGAGALAAVLGIVLLSHLLDRGDHPGASDQEQRGEVVAPGARIVGYDGVQPVDYGDPPRRGGSER